MQLLKKWLFVIKQTLLLYKNKHCLQHASGLAFNTALGIVPILTIFFWLANLIPWLNTYKISVKDFLLKHLVQAVADFDQTALTTLFNHAVKLPTLEIIIILMVLWLLWQNIEIVFNHLFSSKASKYAWFKTLVMSLVVLLVPMILALGFAFSAIIEANLTVINNLNIDVSATLEAFGIMLGLGFINIIFKFMPNCFIAAKPCFIASVITYILLEIAKNGLTWYVETYKIYNMVYGVYAALPIFLLWLFVAWAIILFGASLLKVLS